MIAMIAMQAEAATTILLTERARIARELHDGLLQDAMTIALHLRAVMPSVRAVSEETAQALLAVVELAEKTTTEARRAIMGMRSAETGQRLVEALETTVHAALAHDAVKISTAVMGHARPVRGDIQDGIVRIAREAAANIHRHARAHAVRVTIVFASRRLRITIDDDGRGFDANASAFTDHFGLIGMRERARMMRGALDIRSRCGMGTTVTLEVPLDHSVE
jgi:signal transduction histidine kinase